MSDAIHLLNIETTTKNCSVSISKNGQLVAIKEINDGTYTHATFLNPFISTVLEEAKISFAQLAAVAISKGPGSYTGLRIGVSTAKGLCFALDIPLISLDTLLVLAHQVTADHGVIIPVLDARRMEVYQSIFTTQYKVLQPTEAKVVATNTYDALLGHSKVHFIGDAVGKIQDVIVHENAVFHKQSSPSAREMCGLGYQKFLQNDFENLAYFEPFYLKDFIAVKKL